MERYVLRFLTTMKILNCEKILKGGINRKRVTYITKPKEYSNQTGSYLGKLRKPLRKPELLFPKLFMKLFPIARKFSLGKQLSL